MQSRIAAAAASNPHQSKPQTRSTVNRPLPFKLPPGSASDEKPKMKGRIGKMRVIGRRIMVIPRPLTDWMDDELDE